MSNSIKKKKTIITFGTFDVFHVGHLRILKRARSMGSSLIVGISTDALNFSKKGRNPVYSEAERIEIVSALKCVDRVFEEESLELKGEYIKKYNADILVMGNDWEGKFDEFNNICQVVYFERTPAISTTEVIEKIRT
jgi:glycerol-3-phosphate cytidylyltransferase